MTATAIMYNVQLVNSRHIGHTRHATFQDISGPGAKLNKTDTLFIATAGATALSKRQGLHNPAQA